MKKKLRFKKLISFIKKIVFTELFVMDSLFLLGMFIVILTNFMVNKIFGLYTIGFTLISFSIFLNKTKRIKYRK